MKFSPSSHPRKYPPLGKGSTPFALFIWLAFAVSAFGQYTWTGGAVTDSRWSIGTNWSGNFGPFQNLVANATYTFDGTTQLINSDDVSVSIGSLVFSSGAGAYTIGGTGTTTLTGSITNNSTNTQTMSFSLGLSGTTSINAVSGNISFARGNPGNIGTGAITGSGNLTINSTGTGTVSLGAANSFSGNITVNAGTLSLANDTFGDFGALTAVSRITINNGGTLLISSTATDRINNGAVITLAGGSLKLGGLSSITETVGKLTLSQSSSIDFGSLSSTKLTFDDSSNIVWNGTLSVYNYTQALGVDQLFFNNNKNGLSDAQLAQITFYSGGVGSQNLGTGAIDQHGQVTPNGITNISAVPEPSALFVGLGLCSLVGYRERRWFLRCRQMRRKM